MGWCRYARHCTPWRHARPVHVHACTTPAVATVPCPQVYAEPLCRRHYSGLLSIAVLFRLVLVFGSIAIAIVVAFATGGFWVKLKPTVGQPTVQYTNQALLVFQVGTWERHMPAGDTNTGVQPLSCALLATALQGEAPGDEVVWSTSQTINSQFRSQLVPANVQVWVFITSACACMACCIMAALHAPNAPQPLPSFRWDTTTLTLTKNLTS